MCDMGGKLKLQELVDAMDFHSDEHYQYVDRDTGEIELIEITLLRRAERGDEVPSLPEWQKPQWQAARKAAATDRLVRIPDQFDIHEWQIMADFVESLKAGEARSQLVRAINGNGAFRMFKDAVRRLDLRDACAEFQEDALREIAIEWCEENDFEWE
jgi:hypothetical protein